jgi:hypothetical protein
MKNFWLNNALKSGDVVEYTGYLAARQGTQMAVGSVNGELIECIWFEGANLRTATIKRRFLRFLR